jgi:hypothetical protein
LRNIAKEHYGTDQNIERRFDLDFHQKLQEYGDHPFHGVSLAVIPSGKGDWTVATQRRLPKRKPDIAKRIDAIQIQLQTQYALVAE